MFSSLSHEMCVDRKFFGARWRSGRGYRGRHLTSAFAPSTSFLCLCVCVFLFALNVEKCLLPEME